MQARLPAAYTRTAPASCADVSHARTTQAARAAAEAREEAAAAAERTIDGLRAELQAVSGRADTAERQLALAVSAGAMQRTQLGA